VLEAETNPLVVKPKGQGAVAVDGLIVLGGKRRRKSGIRTAE